MPEQRTYLLFLSPASFVFLFSKKPSPNNRESKKMEAQVSSLVNQGDINNPKPQDTKMEDRWKDGA